MRAAVKVKPDELEVPAFLDQRLPEAKREAAWKRHPKPPVQPAPAVVEDSEEPLDPWPTDVDVLEYVLELAKERGARDPDKVRPAKMFPDPGTRKLIEEVVVAKREKRERRAAEAKERLAGLKSTRAKVVTVSLRQIVTKLSEGRTRVRRRWAMAELAKADRKHATWKYAPEQAAEVQAFLLERLGAPEASAGEPARRGAGKVPALAADPSEPVRGPVRQAPRAPKAKLTAEAVEGAVWSGDRKRRRRGGPSATEVAAEARRAREAVRGEKLPEPKPVKRVRRR